MRHQDAMGGDRPADRLQGGPALLARAPAQHNADVEGPDFLLVGAGRSGTTTVWQWLRGHPDAYMCTPKEPGYFVDGFGIDDPAEYTRLFAPARGRLAGEATTMYLATPGSAARIRDELGDVPILIVLRDPTSRAFSLHAWMYQNGWEPIGDFEAALAAEPGRAWHPEFAEAFRQCLCDYMYFGSGLYSEQVAAYQECFSRVKVLLLDDLQRDPQGSFDGICDFLGLRRAAVAHSGRANASGRPRFPRLQLATRRMIMRVEDRRTWPSRLATVGLWRLIDLNVRVGRRTRLAPTTAAALRQRYAEDVGRTATRIGRDLSSWLPAGSTAGTAQR
jgi:hypothetical protein